MSPSDHGFLVEVDDEDTEVTPIPVFSARARTSADWPPEPPLPYEVDDDLASGTLPGAPRRASMFRAVTRPKTKY